MKLTLETRSANIIHSYEAGKLKIQQSLAGEGRDDDEIHPGQQFITLSGSLVLTPEVLIENWLQDPTNLSIADIERVFETRPEIIILGTGEKLVFPDSSILARCHQDRIGIEVMNTPAACRTYNVLASERRRVAIALTHV